MAVRQRFLHFLEWLTPAQLALQSAMSSLHAAAHCLFVAGCEQHATSVKPSAASLHGACPGEHCGPDAPSRTQRPLALSHTGWVAGQQAPFPQSVPHAPQPGWPTGQHSTWDGPHARQRPLALSHTGCVEGQQAPLPQSMPHTPQPPWPPGQHSTSGARHGGAVVVVVEAVRVVVVVKVIAS